MDNAINQYPKVPTAAIGIELRSQINSSIPFPPRIRTEIFIVWSNEIAMAEIIEEIDIFMTKIRNPIIKSDFVLYREKRNEKFAMREIAAKLKLKISICKSKG